MTEPEPVMTNIAEWAEFGPAMRALRQSRGLSVARLAEQSGVARAKVEAIETGGEPTPDELAQLLFAQQPET